MQRNSFEYDFEPENGMEDVVMVVLSKRTDLWQHRPQGFWMLLLLVYRAMHWPNSQYLTT